MLSYFGGGSRRAQMIVSSGGRALYAGGGAIAPPAERVRHRGAWFVEAPRSVASCDLMVFIPGDGVELQALDRCASRLGRTASDACRWLPVMTVDDNPVAQCLGPAACCRGDRDTSGHRARMVSVTTRRGVLRCHGRYRSAASPIAS